MKYKLYLIPYILIHLHNSILLNSGICHKSILPNKKGRLLIRKLNLVEFLQMADTKSFADNISQNECAATTANDNVRLRTIKFHSDGAGPRHC